MTGPAAQINFMGYAVPNQVGGGIHMRLRARAFAFEGDDGKRVMFVSMDGGMGSDLLNIKVIEAVGKALNDDTIYTLENLSVSGTHTHSGPAGFLQYVVYEFTSWGYVKETMDAFVAGIASAVVDAHNNLQTSTITMNEGDLFESNINRSPTSYLLNPEDERDLYSDIGDTDKNMFLMKIKNDKDEDMAMLNWFAVHGTSMNNTNELISGDNRGLASYMAEKKMNGDATLPGTKGKFVAAFASTNLGDVSPNTAGPKCLDTGLPCDSGTSTCNGKNEMCVSFGPGTNGDMFESKKIIGTKQYEHAMKLYDEATKEIDGGIVDYRHSFINMNSLDVTLENGSVVKTCSAALGYSFAAGTTDGPGMFDFTQGTNSSSPFWNIVSGFLSKPTEEEIECHSPKPILLNTGDCEKPYAWDPETVPISVFRVGSLFILNFPGELTTMAGRRMRKAMKDIIVDGGIAGGEDDVKVVIAGLANTYVHYTTTFEEYQGQRYEAASTLYGPHTLEAYIQEMGRIVKDLIKGVESETDEAPPNLESKQISMAPPVIADYVGIGEKFGDVVNQPKESYSVKAGEVVSAEFRSANPRNNQRLEDTYLSVERKNEDGTYERRYVDSDWCTKFLWKGGLGHAGRSTAVVEWALGEMVQDQPGELEGSWRICHFGEGKKELSKNKEFSGCTNDFVVTA